MLLQNTCRSNATREKAPYYFEGKIRESRQFQLKRAGNSAVEPLIFVLTRQNHVFLFFLGHVVIDIHIVRSSIHRVALIRQFIHDTCLL